MEGEIHLLRVLLEALDRVVGPDATPKERQAAFLDMIEEDTEMAAVVDQLEELTRCHSRSVVEGLYTLAKEEIDSEGGDV